MEAVAGAEQAAEGRKPGGKSEAWCSCISCLEMSCFGQVSVTLVSNAI